MSDFADDEEVSVDHLEDDKIYRWDEDTASWVAKD